MRTRTFFRCVQMKPPGRGRKRGPRMKDRPNAASGRRSRRPMEEIFGTAPRPSSQTMVVYGARPRLSSGRASLRHQHGGDTQSDPPGGVAVHVRLLSFAFGTNSPCRFVFPNPFKASVGAFLLPHGRAIRGPHLVHERIERPAFISGTPELAALRGVRTARIHPAVATIERD